MPSQAQLETLDEFGSIWLKWRVFTQDVPFGVLMTTRDYGIHPPPQKKKIKTGGVVRHFSAKLAKL